MMGDLKRGLALVVTRAIKHDKSFEPRRVTVLRMSHDAVRDAGMTSDRIGDAGEIDVDAGVEVETRRLDGDGEYAVRHFIQPDLRPASRSDRQACS